MDRSSALYVVLERVTPFAFREIAVTAEYSTCSMLNDVVASAILVVPSCKRIYDAHTFPHHMKDDFDKRGLAGCGPSFGYVPSGLRSMLETASFNDIADSLGDVVWRRRIVENINMIRRTSLTGAERLFACIRARSLMDRSLMTSPLMKIREIKLEALKHVGGEGDISVEEFVARVFDEEVHTWLRSSGHMHTMSRETRWSEEPIVTSLDVVLRASSEGLLPYNVLKPHLRYWYTYGQQERVARVVHGMGTAALEDFRADVPTITMRLFSSRPFMDRDMSVGLAPETTHAALWARMSGTPTFGFMSEVVDQLWHSGI